MKKTKIKKEKKNFVVEKDILAKDTIDNLVEIGLQDPAFLESIEQSIKQLKGTYNDKYSVPILDTKGIIYNTSQDLGKAYNIGNASKYMQRYITQNFSKSGNKQDLLKAIHYILFEITRLNKKEREEIKLLKIKIKKKK